MSNVDTKAANKYVRNLPKLESIDFDIIRKCIAPTNILMMNSKKNLEK